MRGLWLQTTKTFLILKQEQCFRKIVRLSHDGRSKLENKVWDRNENTILPEYSLARVFSIKLTDFNFSSHPCFILLRIQNIRTLHQIGYA